MLLTRLLDSAVRGVPALTLGLAAVLVAAGGLAAGLLRAERRSRRARREARDAGREAAARIGWLDRELASRDTVLAAMSEGVWLFDAAGRLAYANGAARTIVGRRFDTASEISPQVVREAVLEVAGRTASSVQPRPVTVQVDIVDVAVEATALPARPPGSVVVVLRDVTRARSIERLRRDFVANASHELKTPVASILALSSALRAAAPDDPRALAGFLLQLEGEADRLAALVHDLLELSRLEGGDSARRELRLDHVVDRVAGRLRGRAEAAGLALRIVALQPLTVFGSETDVAHLVENLVDNAIRYTPGGGEVRLSVGRVDGEAELTVEDTGIGIATRDLDRIFERFYRADSARSRATGGTGLGLSIVRHVAEAHGGTVRCQSVLGAGSTFIVRLPLRGDGGFTPRPAVCR